ncbi:MAG: hypothetical protein ACE5NA_11860 [Nitrospiraceae bacterium]
MSRLRRTVLTLGLISLGVFASFAGTQAHEGGSGGESEGEFDRILGHPGVRMDVRENADPITPQTLVTITIRAGQPETFYTVWLRLVDPDGDGPLKAVSLTGKNSIALAPISALIDLFNVTAPVDLALDEETLPASHCSKDLLLSCEGTTDLVNGFMTDLEGNGSVTIILDYPLSEGAYPLHEAIELGELLDLDFNCANILRANEGAALRLAAHTEPPYDNVGHGLVAGDHDKAFDWYLPPPSAGCPSP